MNKFKIGDNVICIKTIGAGNSLVLNKMYTVVAILDEYLGFEEENHSDWSCTRFKHAIVTSWKEELQ